MNCLGPVRTLTRLIATCRATTRPPLHTQLRAHPSLALCRRRPKYAAGSPRARIAELIGLMAQLADPTAIAATLAAITAPADSLHVSGPKHIWRTNGTKSAFVPPTLTGESGEGAEAAAPKIVPPVEIDESQFTQDVTVVALRLPARKCGAFQSLLKQHSSLLLNRPRIGTIVDGPTKDIKYLLLSISTIDELAAAPQALIDLIQAEKVEVVLYTFQLEYEYFTQDHVLKALLPAGMQIPAGFETVGHIAHLNLSEDQRPYGPVIARVILDKNAHLHTVVNKLGAIASEFRVFDMEVLAGVDSFLAEVREHNCTFTFDFSKVYWNSRLSTEHSRLIDLFRPKELLVDLMCGIGPFVVPAAKKLAAQPKFLNGSPAIMANDLNPDSYKYLKVNMDRNKIASLVAAHNLDGREFLWQVLRPAQTKADSPYFRQPVAHFVMNLPAIAIEFLDAFVGLYAEGQDDNVDVETLRELQKSAPLVHVYCFSRAVDDPLSDLVPRVERALGGRKIPSAVLVRDLATNQQQPQKKAKQALKQAQKDKQKNTGKGAKETATADAAAAATSSTDAAATPAPASLPPLDATHIRFVRNVAPNKDMFCVSFHVPQEVLAATPSWRQQQQAQAQKKNDTASSEDATAESTSASKRKLEEAQPAAAEEEAQPSKKSK